MTLVDRGGTDNLCDLRFKALIDIIGKYESILHLPGLDTAYHCAFAVSYTHLDVYKRQG